MNPIRKLIEHFEGRDELPVEPEDVRQWIVDNGYCEEFIIHYVDCDPEAFDGIYVERQGGELIRQVGVYTEPVRQREIFINARQSEEDRRVAEVKELLHMLDSMGQKTKTKAEVGRMISYAATRLRLSPEPDAVTDVFALNQALMILFPRKARDLLKPFVPNKISVDEVAQIARLPLGYVELVLSDGWNEEYGAMLTVGDALNGGKPVKVVEQEETIYLEAKADPEPDV